MLVLPLTTKIRSALHAGDGELAWTGLARFSKLSSRCPRLCLNCHIYSLAAKSFVWHVLTEVIVDIVKKKKNLVLKQILMVKA